MERSDPGPGGGRVGVELQVGGLGVQLGLLNYAGNNPRFLRLLPGLNLHF